MKSQCRSRPVSPIATTPGSLGQRHDPVPVARLRLGDVVRLHADGREHALELRREPHADRARVRRRADRNDVLDADRPSPRDHFRAIGVEIGLVQMRMRVEELHGTPLGLFTTPLIATPPDSGDERFQRSQLPLCHVDELRDQRRRLRCEVRRGGGGFPSAATSCRP